MNVDRRDVLKGIGGLAATAALGTLDPLGARAAPAARRPMESASPQPAAGFPRKHDFALADGATYLNAAYTHPIPRVAAEAVRRYADARTTLAPAPPGSGGGSGSGASARALFAALINAKPTEIAYVPNTSTGENLVVSALGLDRRFDGNVVTDWLHYEGALAHLLELKRRGLDVRIVRPTKDYRIDLRDLERVIDRRTRLVQISSVAMYNGFRHDVKAVCDLAHAHGAYVYADIIHSAGAEPFDVRATGLDFAACSSFKWLMGDFGLGFLFAREGLLDRIARPQIGYYQAADMTPHYPPFDPLAATVPVSWALKGDTPGHFEVGTSGGAVGVGLAASLAYIQQLGVANIQAHRQPLLKMLREEVPRLGFTLVTPPESTAGVITFARRNVGASELAKKLEAARVNVRVADHWIRLSPSVYNDTRDVERFIEVLSGA